MRGWTIKPCEGCGSIEGRSTNKICKSCYHLMEDGKKWRKYKEGLKKEKNLIAVSAPDNWERPRFEFFISGNYCREEEESLGKTFRLLSHALLKGVEEDMAYNRNDANSFILFKKVKKTKYFDSAFQKERIHLYYKNGESYNFARGGYMQKDVAGYLHRLWSQVNKLILKKEKGAYEYGANMIQRISNGDATVKDFESVLK